MVDRLRFSSERTREPYTKNRRSSRTTSPGQTVLPSRSHRVSKPGTRAERVVSKRCSCSSVSWRKRSLDQMISSVSGWKMTMGRGELTMVSWVATSMLAVTDSM